MILTGSAYTGALADLAAGALTSASEIDALLASSAYTFAAGHDLAAVAAHELSGGGYARQVAGSTFTVATAGLAVSFAALDPAPAFGPMTTTDWRYVVLINHATSAPYLCLDSGAANALAAASLTLSAGDLPYLRLVT